MKSLKLLTILSMFAITYISSGQIVVEWDEIPQHIGTHWTKNSKDSVIVNLGTTGGPHTWDFTSQPMGSENSHTTIVSPLSNPYIDTFPNANLVYSSPTDSDTVYQYYKLNSDFLIMLGMAGASSSTPFVWEYEPSDSITFPQSYGNIYRYRYGFNDEISSGNYIEYFHYGTQGYDAYGTVNIPYDSYECLRICGYDTCAMTIYSNNIPVLYDTTIFIIYQFIAEDYGAVVCVKSYPGETNPNFTDAYIIERLTSFASGIEEPDEPTEVRCLHYPVTLMDYLTIEYSIPEESHVKLIIFDICGRPVRKLVDKVQSGGNYPYRWYGTNDKGELLSPGVYIYRLNACGKTITGKAILMK